MKFALEIAVVLGLLCSTATALADPLANPPMTGPLPSNPTPIHIDAGSLGKIYVSGVVSGIGLVQDNTALGDREAAADLSNRADMAARPAP